MCYAWTAPKYHYLLTIGDTVVYDVLFLGARLLPRYRDSQLVFAHHRKALLISILPFKQRLTYYRLIHGQPAIKVRDSSEFQFYVTK